MSSVTLCDMLSLSTGRAEPRARQVLAAFPDRGNSLNALRLALAVLVIVSHAWPIGGFGADPRLGDATLGEIAVAGFFTVSGWLILQSRLAGRLPGFLWRRAVRIYPGYLAALVVVGFGFAPLGALISDGYYSPVDGARYVAVNLTLYIRDYGVGASLPPEAFPAWNGSLWTLASEAVCYLLVGLLVSVCPRAALRPVVVAAWVALTAAEVAGLADGAPFLANDLLSLAPFFFAGATLFVLRDRVPLGGGTAAVAGAVLVALWVVEADKAFAAVPIAYLMMWLGAVLPLRTLGRRHDLSYGMYIYAFPVQQLLALAGVTAYGVGVYTLAGIVCTVPFAAASWWLVERPAQRARGWCDGPRARADGR
jgi:peptidoglycan/LPS O-acetylase OafA/YrhL